MYSSSIRVSYKENTPLQRQFQFVNDRGDLLYSPLVFARQLLNYSDAITALELEEWLVVSLVETNKFDAYIFKREDAMEFYQLIHELKAKNPAIQINDYTEKQYLSKFPAKNMPKTKESFFDNSPKASSQDDSLFMIAAYTGLTLMLIGGVLSSNILIILIATLALIALTVTLAVNYPEQYPLMRMM